MSGQTALCSAHQEVVVHEKTARLNVAVSSHPDDTRPWLIPTEVVCMFQAALECAYALLGKCIFNTERDFDFEAVLGSPPETPAQVSKASFGSRTLTSFSDVAMAQMHSSANANQ
ncbi:hypothetical protein FI667_g12745, partial [Globisporangium splendens]